MQGKNNMKYNYLSKDKKNISPTSYSNQFIIYNSNNSNNYYKALIIQKSNNYKHHKEKVKKTTNIVNVKPIPKKIIYNNSNNINTIQKYGYKTTPKKVVEDNNEQEKAKNLSGYKKILDKMVEQYATNNKSKENINNLLKNSIIKQKNAIINKVKIFSPAATKNLENNIKIENIKKICNTGNNRSFVKKELYRDKVIKIQSFWRGYYIRKIVVRGMKKYYGLVFIYKLIKKFMSKRNKIILDIIKGTKMKKNNSKKDFLYTRKLIYNNHSVNSKNTDKNSFSFSKTANDLEKSDDIINNSYKNTKSFYSNENKIQQQPSINSYTHNYTEIRPRLINSRLIQTQKITDLYDYANSYKENNNNTYCSLKKKYEGNAMTTSIILGEGKNSKIGKITSNFFNKYDEKMNQPIYINSRYYFRKPIFKKVNTSKYIHFYRIGKDSNNYSSKKI